MTEIDERFHRNMLLFGKQGQRKLRRTAVAVVGVGGLGTHVVQQLAHLGVGAMSLIDLEALSESNKNRYVGARHDDAVQREDPANPGRFLPGMPKTDLGARTIAAIDPTIQVNKVPKPLLHKDAFEAITASDWVFGCLDDDGPRFVLNELCAAYERPYIDLASDVVPDGAYGGRVVVAQDGRGCVYCFDELDNERVQQFLASEKEKDNKRALYGVDRDVLGEAGPSVVSINGVVASLGVTEFMVAATGMRPPLRLLNYRGDRGVVSKRSDSGPDDCYYCRGIRGKGKAAEVERYLLLEQHRHR